MAKALLLEEFHVTITARGTLSEPMARAIYRTLHSKSFRWELDQAVRAVVRRHPALAATRWTLGR